MASAFEGAERVEAKEAEKGLPKSIPDWKKSEIVDLHLQGLTRDDIAKKTGVSAGAVSGVIKEFTERADSSSIEEAAEQYGVVETVERLRSLAVEVKKAGTSVEELMQVSNILGRIRRLIDLDRLEEFIKAGESLGDKAHVEAAVRMHIIEERTGKSHDDVLSDLEAKEAKVRELSSEIQRLQSQLKNLRSEGRKAQADFRAEKAGLEMKLGEHLKQHSLTLERMERISEIEKGLNVYGIELTQLEGLQRVLKAVQEANHDAEELVELAEKVGSLRVQVEAEKKDLDNTRDLAARLGETVAKLEERSTEAKLVMERCRELESMGWNREILEKAIRLAGEAGDPEEVLGRLELLKPSADAKAELERIKAERDALEEEVLKTLSEAVRTVSTLAEESSNLVNEKIPTIVAEASSIMKTQIGELAKEYNNLAEKYDKLQADLSRVVEEYLRHQKSLDDAIGWTTLLQEPEKLPGDRIGHIFLDVMFPRLEIWCKSKEHKERATIAGELAKRAVCLYTEPASKFMSAPSKASVDDAIFGLISFATATIPFYAAFKTWYALHKNEAEAFKLFNAQYHLDKFYQEGMLKLKG